MQINVKKLVKEWFANPNENLGIAIHAYDNSHGTPLIVGHPDESQSEDVQVMSGRTVVDYLRFHCNLMSLIDYNLCLMSLTDPFR